MAKIKEDNYVCVQGWMLSKLGLKGNSLLIYAIIYGFCQDGHSCFHGSLDYLQQWTNSTRQGVIKVLKELLEQKLIRKETSFPNNKYYLYDASMYKTAEDVNIVNNDVNNVNIESKQCLQNNKEENIDNNKSTSDLTFNDLLIKQSKYKYNKKTSSKPKKKYVNYKEVYHDSINEILNYLDSTCSTDYMISDNEKKRDDAAVTIGKRLEEGYKIEDFYTVIDAKYKEWGIYPRRFKNGNWSNSYLRPGTLFGDKMGEYLHQAWLNYSESNEKVTQTTKLKERSDKIF